jgi:radical SAM protein (TIGR01212 family)
LEDNMNFPYTADNKRYHTLNFYNRATFGGRVCKASLDAGCGCPQGSCIFCDSGSRYFTGQGTTAAQLLTERQRIHQKYPAAKLIAYFQAGTNTFGDLHFLAQCWDAALDCPDVVGISIATRADCLGPAVLSALERLRDKTALTVELGLQTVHDETAKRIGRGHDFSTFLQGYEALRDRNIRTCVHLIDGLPGENREMMLETARQVGKLRPGGVKLHLLHVTQGTPLAALWQAGNYQPLEREEYIDILTEQLRYFPPETVMERLTGDGDKSKLLAPLWSRDKIAVLGGIDQAMAKKDIWQGDKFLKK